MSMVSVRGGIQTHCEQRRPETRIWNIRLWRRYAIPKTIMADINFYVWWIHHHDPAFLVLAANLGPGLGAAGLGLGAGYGIGNGLGAALGYPTGNLGGRGESCSFAFNS